MSKPSESSSGSPHGDNSYGSPKNGTSGGTQMDASGTVKDGSRK